jgi:hypothetical protein
MMTELGFTKEELQQRVIDSIVDRLMTSESGDDEGRSWVGESEFSRKLEKQVQGGIDAAVSALAEKHILPNVHAYIENLTLQQTNKWGETQGEPVTFIEYLTKRAEAYMVEEVNYEGKTKGESGGYSWAKAQARLAHMVDKHLHYSIDTAMKAALQTANSAIAEGIEKTVRIKLDEIVKGLKTTVATK